MQGTVLDQRGAGDNLGCVCQSGAAGADWRKVKGRSSSLGERRCSDAQEISSGQRKGLIWQQQSKCSYRKKEKGNELFQDDPLKDFLSTKVISLERTTLKQHVIRGFVM